MKLTGEVLAHVLFMTVEIIGIAFLIAMVAATLFVDYTNQKKLRANEAAELRDAVELQNVSTPTTGELN